MWIDETIGRFAALLLAAAFTCEAPAFDAPRLAVGTLDALDGDSVAVSNATAFRAGASFYGDVSFGGVVRVSPASGFPMGVFTNAGASAARPGPAWWAERGILDNAAEVDDFAVVAQGQVKWMADRAAAGFAEAGALAGGSGIRAAYLVASFSPSNNAMPAALGQVRATAEPFWRRLGELGLCEPPAWLDAAGDDFAVANVGQAKAAFSFALPPTPDPDADADGDGMLNGWEIAHGLDPYDAADAAGDVDGDGLSNFEESQFGTDPRATDTDGDGLSDIEEAGTVAVERKFMWLDLSGAENLLAGRIESDAASWTLPLSAPVAINGVDYTNAYVCLDGTVHLLCPTNTRGWAVERSNYGGLGGSQWSGTHVTVAICATDLYARPEDWGSRVRMGCAESGGRTFTVVEYSDVGLRGTDARAAFQLILPHDETNAVYVSYLRVSGEIRSAAPVAGVQCGWMQSFRGWDQVYNVSWPAGLPPDATTVRYSIGTGTDPCAVDTDDDGLSDFDEATGFRSDPLSEDTDGDGLSDAEEAGLGTNPRCVDTDGDGMPDLWEALHHLCPRRDDAAEDLDEDGLSNIAEFEAGTDPSESDTDEDGLSDTEELGLWERTGPLPVFDVSSGTNLLLSSQSYDGASFVVPLPFAVRCAGRVHTNMTVCLDGVVALMDAGEASSFYVSPVNGDLRTSGLGDRHTAVAAYWDDLYAPANEGAGIRVADIETNGLRYAVIEYAGMRLYSRRGDAGQTATFQIVVPQAEPNAVYVHYVALSSAFDGSSATLGAQFAKRARTFAVAFNEAGSVTNGMVVAYRFGTGSDPRVADTDGDGLSDAEEVMRGTNPGGVDSDGDGLPDGWESGHGLDPLSAAGAAGADGDPDGDFLSNAKEFEYGTSPSVPDTDGDALPDGIETGGVFATNAIPWLPFDECEDLTAVVSTNYNRCVSRPFPAPLRIQGECVTNVTISANGIVFFDRAGYANPGSSMTDASFAYGIDGNALVIAPYLQRAYIRSDVAGMRTSIRYGTATHDGEGYLLLEWLNSYYDTSSWQTNAISFQIAVPTNSPDRAYSRYRDVVGRYVDGRYASIGMQTFDARWLHSWCHRSEGRVGDGLALEFLFGVNTDPLVADTDGDGVDDGREVELGTSPLDADTDGDGLPDGWEVRHGLDPLSAFGDDGADGDPDGDYLFNAKEFEHGTDPRSADTDGDGLTDVEEVGGLVADSQNYLLAWDDFPVVEDYTPLFGASEGRSVLLNLSTPARFPGGRLCSGIEIDPRGLVRFSPTNAVTGGGSVHASFDLETLEVGHGDFAVAAYWAPLVLSTNAPASRIALVRWIVGDCIEFSDMRLEGFPDDVRVSFLVIPPTEMMRCVGLWYRIFGDAADGGEAVIGAKGANGRFLSVFCDHAAGTLEDGMMLYADPPVGSDPLVADTDGDGLSDLDEARHGSDPRVVDTDGDGLLDAEEVMRGTNPGEVDSDGDGLSDGWEVAHGLNPLSAAGDDGADGDLDGDGLTNLQERTHGGNPRSSDTDGDGLSDGRETELGTNPRSPDTDCDGLSDRREVELGTDPCSPDTDGDGMTDGWETAHGLDPSSAADDDGADGDPDHDGLSNLDEYLNDTDPLSADTDGDGVSDRIEVERGADPANPSDGGVAPPPERTRTLTFNVFGDFAAWEMQIEGLGPGDTRVRRISMASPNASESEVLEMRKGSSYRLMMRWLNCNGHNGDRDAPWYCWQAKVDGHPDERTYDNYSSKRREGVAETVAGNGWIAENADGLLTSHVDECARRGGNVAGGLSATLHVLDNPRIVPDYNRDGKIDQDDEAVRDSESAAFWFWVNDDDDCADVNKGVKDRPGEGVNFRDNRVNGRGDLLDFTPMLLDVSTAFPPEMPYDIRTGVVWRLESSVVNAVWTSLDAENAGAFHRTNCGAAFGTALSQEARRAAVAHLSDGEDLSRSFAGRMNASGGRGVVMVEGCRKGAGLSLAGRFGDYETPVAKGELDIQILPVGEMYRYVTLRGAHESTNFTVRIPGACSNFMARCADADVFFTHGFNVSEEEARAWGAETFKRLWQSGSNARFWAATWSGDCNWLGKAFNALHYHQDVYQALRTGAAFKAFVEEAQHDPSKRVLMAHSLGNMVVCEALRRGMSAGKYFMLNAAVASEAFDGLLQSVDAAIRSKYVPSDWDGYDSLSWAANWHKWFKDDSSDMRGRMGWPDYFKPVLENAAEVYNYYSSGDPIFLETGDDPGLTTGVFHWPTFRSEWDFVDFNVTFEAHCWQKQETHKGVEPIAGTIAGGWGFNCWTSLLPDVLQPAFYSADEANEAVASGAVTNKPVFHCGGTPMGNRNATSNDVYLSLAKYVPAVSSPIGGGPLCITEGKSVDLNVDENSAEVIPRPNGWGRDGGVHRQSWLHSDMKDMAYFYVYELYEQLVIKGALK